MVLPKDANDKVRLCRDFMDGQCPQDAEKCAFLHDKKFCRRAWSGECTFGSRCRFRHDYPAASARDMAAAKRRKLSADAQQRLADEVAERERLEATRKEAAAAVGKKTPAAKGRAHRGPGTQAASVERDADHSGDEGSRGIVMPVAARAADSSNKVTQLRKGKAKNTETFTPSHAPPDMRIVVDAATDRMSFVPTVRDVTVHPMMFKKTGDRNLYARLKKEVEAVEKANPRLMKHWHGDSHWIADDSTGWKKHCPTFTSVVDRIQQYFGMEIRATRYNLYKDTSEWKPFHHDAAAVKPDKAKSQNFTVAVSFGCTRDAAFEEVESKKVISMPQTDGMVYCFSRDVNIMWKHGILQVPPAKVRNEGRISIIAWGWIPLDEVNAPPAKLRA